MDGIAANLEKVGANIRAACEKVGRDASDVTLIAVSKTFAAADVNEAFLAGQIHFGENRLQEAEGKIPLLPSALQWHYIGQLQRNKVRKVLPLFSMIHSIDSLRLAQYTNELAGEVGLFPRVFLQVNLAAETSKGGFSAEQLTESWDALLSLDRLEIQGLMTVPPIAVDPEKSRSWFARLRELRDQLQGKSGVSLPALSMGMSGDYGVAIEEGATHVRVGSAVFGGREYPAAPTA
ncbi:MAG: YggS family pyridoxal phosphate-dependent enzyme [Verrucomicrobia bacterium]|nr:YggS family pyridoxal phosphate-dependent enzyme [Verrucomicrobiota bacterium]